MTNIENKIAQGLFNEKAAKPVDNPIAE